MLVGGVHGCIYAEVYTDAIAHELFAIKGLSDLDRRFDVEEGYYDATERLERRPCVYFRIFVYGFADLGEG